MRALALIGAGGMAATFLEGLSRGLGSRLGRLSILARPGREQPALALAERAAAKIADACAVRTTLDALLADSPDVVVECAGHAAVREYGRAILRSGRDFIVISGGALADDALRETLESAARAGQARLILAAGAVGGLDLLAAARLSGLEEVIYTGRKPPPAWRGTTAEGLVDLDAAQQPVKFFDGFAREAARLYPQNANVAAAVALAGLGFDATRVRLVADPGQTRNVHEIAVRSACADFTIRIEGRASPVNPKTSLTAGFSLARECLNLVAHLIV